MDLIDIVDGKLIIKPEVLLISPFNELWNNDKTKEKKNATNQIKFIWYFHNFKSPYKDYPEAERAELIIRDIIHDNTFKADKQALNKYYELNVSQAERMVESANSLMNKMELYFKNVQLEKVDVKKVTDVFINMPKIINSLNEAKKACIMEQANGTKIRGNADIGMFENA